MHTSDWGDLVSQEYLMWIDQPHPSERHIKSITLPYHSNILIWQYHIALALIPLNYLQATSFPGNHENQYTFYTTFPIHIKQLSQIFNRYLIWYHTILDWPGSSFV